MDYSKKRGQKYHDTHKAREIELMSLRNRRGIYQQIADKMVVCSDEFASNLINAVWCRDSYSFIVVVKA